MISRPSTHDFFHQALLDSIRKRKRSVDRLVQAKFIGHTHVNWKIRVVNGDALVRACSAASAKTSQKLKSQYSASKPSIHAALTILLLLRRSDVFPWVSTPSSLACKCINKPVVDGGIWFPSPQRGNARAKPILGVYSTRSSNCGTISPYVHYKKHETPPSPPSFFKKIS